MKSVPAARSGKHQRCSGMDVNRSGMRDTVLALLLAVLQGFPLGETAPNLSPLVGSNWGSPRRYVHLQTSTELNNFYLEIRLDGTVRKTTVRSSYSKLCFTIFQFFPFLLSFFSGGYCGRVISLILWLLLLCRCDFSES